VILLLYRSILFGYGSGYDVSFEERYKLIRKSGFDCVMLWWSNQFGRGDSYQEDVRLARRAGLFAKALPDIYPRVPLFQFYSILHVILLLYRSILLLPHVLCFSRCCVIDVMIKRLYELEHDKNQKDKSKHEFLE